MFKVSHKPPTGRNSTRVLNLGSTLHQYISTDREVGVELGEGIIVNFEDSINNTGDYACINCPDWSGKTVADVVNHIHTDRHKMQTAR